MREISERPTELDAKRFKGLVMSNVLQNCIVVMLTGVHIGYLPQWVAPEGTFVALFWAGILATGFSIGVLVTKSKQTR